MSRDRQSEAQQGLRCIIDYIIAEGLDQSPWTPLSERQADQLQILLLGKNPEISNRAFRMCMWALHEAATKLTEGRVKSIFEFSDQIALKHSDMRWIIEEAERLLTDSPISAFDENQGLTAPQSPRIHKDRLSPSSISTNIEKIPQPSPMTIEIALLQARLVLPKSKKRKM